MANAGQQISRPPCEGCSARDATWPAIVEKVSATEWKLAPDGDPVHLAALFRDPGISDDRHVPVVLDIRPDTRPLRRSRLLARSFPRSPTRAP